MKKFHYSQSIKIKFKIYYQLLLIFTYEVCWELHWWLDEKMIKFYKWLLRKHK